MPPIRILVGTNDCLYDDCWNYMKRLKNVGNDCHMFIYRNVRHGILTQCGNGAVSAASEIISDVGHIIKGLLSLKKE